MAIIRTIKASGLFSVSLIVTVKKREQTISGSFPSSSKSLKSGILLSRSISLTDPQMLCHDEPRHRTLHTYALFSRVFKVIKKVYTVFYTATFDRFSAYPVHFF